MRFQDVDPRVKAMYQGVALVLNRYRSGKLPKAFKLVPSLQNWEQILYLTSKFVRNLAVVSAIKKNKQMNLRS